MEASEVDVCMDTNVLIDIETISNALEEVNNNKKLMMRFRNMKGSWALARMLHVQRKRVFCFGGETQDILDKKINARTSNAAWSWLQRNFISEFIFDMSQYILDGSFPERSLKGNERDRMLVAEAKKRGVILVTREKNRKGAIAREARKLGVCVMAPEEYVQHCGFSVDKLAEDLLLEIDRTFPVFVICETRDSQLGGAWSSYVFIENCRAYFAQLETVLTGNNECLVSLAGGSIASRSEINRELYSSADAR